MSGRGWWRGGAVGGGNREAVTLSHVLVDDAVDGYLESGKERGEERERERGVKHVLLWTTDQRERLL